MIKTYRDQDIHTFISQLQKRRQQDADVVETAVREIIDRVRKTGDTALIQYGIKFDQVDLSRTGIAVPEKDLKNAHSNLDSKILQIIRKARGNIERFHRKALPQSWVSWEEDGVMLGQRAAPLQWVGIYVPGGRAAYPSSLLMAAVPAMVAGVEELIITTPCNRQGEIHAATLAIAWELGIKRIFRVGGAQAIAAMAFGTASIPRVDKIVGPGNAYVATAKKMLYGQVSIDMVAGPSEVVVVADQSATPSFIAADLLAQAEHDPMASAILITDSDEIADNVVLELREQSSQLPRKKIIESSLQDFGAILITSGIDQSAAVANELAPEHLCLHLDNPWDCLHLFKNAGAIFLGHFSPETVGDYWAGPNHILPTNGTARFFSPLRTEDFFKMSSLISYSRQAMQKNGSDITQFADLEGLTAHAQAIRVRSRL
ncbi:histidinol dehydrogenase [candidate division KSB1 bacterium]|nr:histidinol dehydrogenase [candidate division KSB1 bacterium]